MHGIKEENLKAIEDYKLLKINLETFLNMCKSMFEYKLGKKGDDFTVKITAKKDYPQSLNVPYYRSDVISVLKRYLRGEFDEHELWNWATILRLASFYDPIPNGTEEEHDLVLDTLDEIDDIGYRYFDNPVKEYIREKLKKLEDFKSNDA